MGTLLTSSWLLAGSVALLAVAPVVSAEPPGASATATAHARDELANAIAQGKITPTPTPQVLGNILATTTPSPTASPTSAPTDTPTPSPTSTPQPCWLTDPDTGDVIFDELGAPVPCSLEVAQVLPPGGPPDDGLAIDPNAPLELAPPPADPNNPDAPQPTPIVIVIVATAAPVPTLPPEIVYVQQPPAAAVPTSSAAQVIYLVVTPTPQGAAIAEPTASGASLPALVPMDALVSAQATAPVEDEPSPPTADPEPVSDVPSQPGAPADDPPPAPARVPPPMLISFGLWAGMRRQVEEGTPPWLPAVS